MKYNLKKKSKMNIVILTICYLFILISFSSCLRRSITIPSENEITPSVSSSVLEKIKSSAKLTICYEKSLFAGKTIISIQDILNLSSIDENLLEDIAEIISDGLKKYPNKSIEIDKCHSKRLQSYREKEKEDDIIIKVRTNGIYDCAEDSQNLACRLVLFTSLRFFDTSINKWLNKEKEYISIYKSSIKMIKKPTEDFTKNHKAFTIFFENLQKEIPISKEVEAFNKTLQKKVYSYFSDIN
ncbi:MAG: hypothetical protein OEZ13_11125 [Spirochaetia bacterium]|nr:hypothetical protein [Spirochaetia bacterium]